METIHKKGVRMLVLVALLLTSFAAAQSAEAAFTLTLTNSIVSGDTGPLTPVDWPLLAHRDGDAVLQGPGPSVTFANIPAGRYTIWAAVNPGYINMRAVCTQGTWVESFAASDAFDFEDGQDVTCHIYHEFWGPLINPI